MKTRKQSLLPFVVAGIVVALVLSSGFAQANSLQEPLPILELTIPSTARVVDHDNGIYVVGTGGDSLYHDSSLYVINEAGEYTVTQLGAGPINDVRIENGFIAVAAGNSVIELELVSLPDLTPTELWRTTLSGWRKIVSTDLSEDGDYVCYLARRTSSYTNAGEVGVLGGGAGGGSLISRLYASGYYICNWWLDATGDMEYIAASQPMYGCCYKVGVALYQFDDSTLTMNWWKHLIARYDVTEVRVSEAMDWVAAATSSGTEMCLLDLATGNESPRYNTPGKEQYAVDGDDNLNYVIGANQAWSPPYGWFILENLGASGYHVVAEGTMVGRISDLDANHDASLLAFGSNQGQFLLLSRSNSSIDTVFDATVDTVYRLIDAVEIGSHTLLVGGQEFIYLYGLLYPVAIDIKPQSCPNAFRTKSKGVLPVAILGTEDFDVMTVDPATVLLEGVAPLRDSLEDVSRPVEPGEDTCYCTTDLADGYLDMTLKFDHQEILAALGPVTDGEVRVLTLTGMTYEGMPIEGKDCVVIIHKEPSKLSAEMVREFSLGNNYPNPFNLSTSISFYLSVSSNWSLSIYNITGQLVKSFEGYSSGQVSITWDGKDGSRNEVASGIYLYKLSAGDLTSTKKMVLIK